MNIFTAFKNFVVGAPKITEDVFDSEKGLLVKAGGFLNDLHYSDAEKAKDTAAVGANITEFVKMSLQESTVKSQTRREFAVQWIRVQLVLIMVTVIAIPFNEKMATKLFEVATCNIMLWGTGSIIVFFFGGYVWGTYVKGGKA